MLLVSKLWVCNSSDSASPISFGSRHVTLQVNHLVQFFFMATFYARARTSWIMGRFFFQKLAFLSIHIVFHLLVLLVVDAGISSTNTSSSCSSSSSGSSGIVFFCFLISTILYLVTALGWGGKIINICILLAQPQTLHDT